MLTRHYDRAAILTEKRRKRRESHNAVERRRRDNINDRITELASLLPACLLEPAPTPYEEASPPADSPRSLLSTSLLGTSPALILGGISSINLNLSASQMAAAQQGKPNKGIILSKSVDYIKYLQQLVELHAGRNRELELVVEDLRGGGDPNQVRSAPMSVKAMSGSNSSHGSTSRQPFPSLSQQPYSAHPAALDFRTYSPSPSSFSPGAASSSFHPSSLPATFGSLSQYMPERFPSNGVVGRFGGREEVEEEEEEDGFEEELGARRAYRAATTTTTTTRRRRKKEEDEDEYMDE